jgi:hypothetical protein
VDNFEANGARSSRLNRMIPTSPLQSAVHSDLDLRTLWESLMGDEGFSRRSLWLVFLDAEGRVAPTIVPIDDVPDVPDDGLGTGLATIVAGLRDTTDVDSVAVLVSRPGGRAMTDADRRWARFLTRQPHLTARWPAHLATRGNVQVFAPDDLV